MVRFTIFVFFITNNIKIFNFSAPKGNSLFAEVDDKRQEMVKSYSQLKDKVFQVVVIYIYNISIYQFISFCIYIFLTNLLFLVK